MTITDGNSYADILITPVDDSDPEADETVLLALASGSGYTIGSPDNDTVTITDNDDPEVTISATDASAAEEALTRSAIDEAIGVIPTLLTQGEQRAKTALHTRTKPIRPDAETGAGANE